ncbi:GNAT family N-acetyltransferase [Streptomyces ureilyticus]|uniref:GNAT family N-acetyltransferase n=1 Tax=Streptomyces ureilyticus TaxID=1775131 RepID=A0ABX0DLQ3_9ACTN|nr:GNAT family N-acetyltransferase [Streptomyces ureilyticus]NGO41669.1 GNAT family N-acetyltransferase [Streptomyces ureilyticus]
MTTTLRPAEPLQREADGALSRHYKVCVNSRPVGAIHLATHPLSGPSVAQIRELGIDEPDRRRGRGTVAALAAEEVARGWGCRRIEVSVPGAAEAALRLATALGYLPRERTMEKRLGGTPPVLPAGSRGRPMTEAEARAKSGQEHATSPPAGLAIEDMAFSVLEHEGTPVGTLRLGARDGTAYVLDVETDERYRRRGHGRTLLLLAEAHAIAAGRNGIRINVPAGNTPAERLCESLGYETITYLLSKDLL